MSLALLFPALLFLGCINVTIPGEDAVDSTTGTTGNGTGTTPTPIVDEPDTSGPQLVVPDAGGAETTAPSDVLIHCAGHCDCPPGEDCINGRCVLGDMPIYCCSHPGCPAGEGCWDQDDAPGTCPGS